MCQILHKGVSFPQLSRVIRESIEIFQVYLLALFEGFDASTLTFRCLSLPTVLRIEKMPEFSRDSLYLSSKNGPIDAVMKAWNLYFERDLHTWIDKCLLVVCTSGQPRAKHVWLNGASSQKPARPRQVFVARSCNDASQDAPLAAADVHSLGEPARVD